MPRKGHLCAPAQSFYDKLSNIFYKAIKLLRKGSNKQVSLWIDYISYLWYIANSDANQWIEQDGLWIDYISYLWYIANSLRSTI